MRLDSIKLLPVRLKNVSGRKCEWLPLLKWRVKAEAKCLGNKNGLKWMAWHGLCWPSVCGLSWCRNATAFRMWMLCFWGLNSVHLFLCVFCCCCFCEEILPPSLFFSFSFSFWSCISFSFLCCIITCAFSILCVFSFKKQYFVFK